MIKLKPVRPELGSIIGSIPQSPFSSGSGPLGYEGFGGYGIPFQGGYNYFEIGFADYAIAMGGYPNALFQVRQYVRQGNPTAAERDALYFDLTGGRDSKRESLLKSPYLLAENLDKASGSGSVTLLYWTVDGRVFQISADGVVSPVEIHDDITVTASPDPPTVPDYGAKGGYSIEPPPPIRGGTSNELYFRPGWWQVYETGRQEAQKANPDLHKVYSGLIVSPLAYLEEYLVRPLLNVPHTALNKVISAGQHLDRASLWLQQDAWAEASADALEAVTDLSLAFLDVAGLVEALGLEGLLPGGRQPAPRASLAGEIPSSVPQEYVGAVSKAAGDSGGMLGPELKSALPSETTESAFANLIDNSEFSSHPEIIDRLSRARQFDLGGYKSLTAKGKYGRRYDGLDSDEALQNAFVRNRKGISRHDPLLADNPAAALSPELHRQIGNLTSFEGRSATDVLRLHIDQMRGFAPDYVLVILERESLQFIKLLGL